MNLTELATFITNWGFAFGIAIIAIFMVLKEKKYRDEKRRRKDKLDKIDLKNHNLFSTMFNMINIDLNNLNIKNKKTGEYDIKRNNLASDFLKIKFYVWKKGLEKFINNDAIKNYTSTQFYNAIKLVFTELIVQYEYLARKMGLPEIFIQKFNEWHKERVDLTLKFIEIIAESDVYENEVKINVIYDNFITAFEGTIYDAKHTLRALNGQLDDVKYEKQIFDYKTIQKLYSDEQFK